MKLSDIPARFNIPFAASAGGGYITYPIPEVSQVGIEDGRASLETGFPPLNFLPVGSGGVPPFGQDMNGLLKQVTAWSRWAAAGQPITFNSGWATANGGYPQGAIIASTVPGLLWVCLADDNTGDPDAGAADWAPINVQNNLNPVYPEVATSDGKMSFTTSTGQAILGTGFTWIWRANRQFSSSDFTLGNRTFATAASKTYHVVWDAPGTGLATPASTYPKGRLSLIDLTSASPAETDPSYDTTFDRMLIGRIVTNGSNVLTVTNLSNKSSLAATATKTSSTTGPNWQSLTPLTVSLNWSRTPLMTPSQLTADISASYESLVNIGCGPTYPVSGEQFGTLGTGLTRYGGVAWAIGYIFDPDTPPITNRYGSFPLVAAMRA